MSETIRLIAMQCPRCTTPVPAQAGEVAWVCLQCGQGMLLSDEQGVTGLDVFFSAAIGAGKTGTPYWVARGVVRPLLRQAYRGNAEQEMHAFWAVPRLFYVPALRLPVEQMVAAGVALLRQPVRMEPGSPVPFTPVVVPPEDVRPTAEFMVMSLEADRKDMLKEFQFEIKIDPPQLWILP
jgi:hypothetical protein